MARKNSVTVASAPEERALNRAGTDAESTIAPVSSSYCLPDKADLMIARFEPTGEQLLYSMCDTSGKLVFYATDDSNWDSSKATLRDASGKTVVLLKCERSNLPGGGSLWGAFREDSEQEQESDSNLLFTIIHNNSKFNSSFDITIPNRRDDVSQPRFTARTKLFGSGFAVVFRDGINSQQRTRIAQAQRRKRCFAFPGCRKNRSKIEISAQVDRAFIASIFVLVDLARRRRRSSSPTVPESAEASIVLGIPVSPTLHNTGIRWHQLAASQQWKHAPGQWVSPSEDAFQAYNAYHQTYISGHETQKSEKLAAPGQWVSLSKDAFQAFNAYNQTYISGRETQKSENGTHELAGATNQRRKHISPQRMSPSEDAFQAYNAYHQMYISGHDTR